MKEPLGKENWERIQTAMAFEEPLIRFRFFSIPPARSTPV
jgi:hypothetical protein